MKRLTSCSRIAGSSSETPQQIIGASARLFTNAPTIILSVFATWGWFAEVRAWPPSFADVGVIAMAAITLTTQQLANALAAQTNYAVRRRGWLTVVAAAALSLAFAGVTAFGVDDAFTTASALMRERAAASIEREVIASAAPHNHSPLNA